jgi:hypothetical protein
MSQSSTYDVLGSLFMRPHASQASTRKCCRTRCGKNHEACPEAQVPRVVKDFLAAYLRSVPILVLGVPSS